MWSDRLTPQRTSGRTAAGLSLLSCSLAVCAHGSPSPVSVPVAWLAWSFAAVSGGHALLTAARAAQRLTHPPHAPNTAPSPTKPKVKRAPLKPAARPIPPQPTTRPLAPKPTRPVTTRATPPIVSQTPYDPFGLPDGWTAQPAPEGTLITRPDNRRFLITTRPATPTRGTTVIVLTPGPRTPPTRTGTCWHLTGQTTDLLTLMEDL